MRMLRRDCSARARYSRGVRGEFFYRPEMLSYDFGAGHPLNPERLRRAIALAEAEGIQVSVPPPATDDDLLRIHTRDYLEAVKRAGEGIPSPEQGLGYGDNPLFSDMHGASLWYVGGSAAAARAVCDGSPLAISLSGGLHHAMPERASGFCIYNDLAVAISLLRERFSRVAYIDIDVHHGDGVQWIFYDDPTVLTISIHESGRSLFPGTGFVGELGTEKTSLNIPVNPGTTGDVWLEAFRAIVPTAVRRFGAEAIVLQMGTDTHALDPIAHVNLTAQEWLEAVREVRGLDLPTVACGGGGYNLRTVPRMWIAAALTLLDRDVPEGIPADVQSLLEVSAYLDADLPTPRRRGETAAEDAFRQLKESVEWLSVG